MNVLIDTNVVLDILLRREPYYLDAARVSVLSENGHIHGYISASAVTDIFYIARKETKSRDAAFALVSDILKTTRVAAVAESDIFEALKLKWDDFEDSVQYVAGKSVSVEYIITRDPDDFASGSIAAISPGDFLDQFFSKS
jgi:predicted nucleic acid-binding protein